MDPLLPLVVALSMPETCGLETVFGTPPFDVFRRAPERLLRFFFLHEGLLHGTHDTGDHIVWDGTTGEVLAFWSHEDRRILHPIVSNPKIAIITI
jgi:hypothetical protein